MENKKLKIDKRAFIFVLFSIVIVLSMFIIINNDEVKEECFSYYEKMGFFEMGFFEVGSIKEKIKEFENSPDFDGEYELKLNRMCIKR